MHCVQAQLVTPFARARHSSFMLIHVTAPNLCSAPMATPLCKGVPLEPCGMKHHLPAHLAPAPAHRYVCHLFFFSYSFIIADMTPLRVSYECSWVAACVRPCLGSPQGRTSNTGCSVSNTGCKHVTSQQADYITHIYVTPYLYCNAACKMSEMPYANSSLEIYAEDLFSSCKGCWMLSVMPFACRAASCCSLLPVQQVRSSVFLCFFAPLYPSFDAFHVSFAKSNPATVLLSLLHLACWPYMSAKLINM